MSTNRTRTRTRKPTPAHAPAAQTPAPIIYSYAPGVDPYRRPGQAPCGRGTPRDPLAELHRCTCPGCSPAHPPRECACCGAPTVIALDAGAHALTLCRKCARDLLAARAECRREMAEETRAKMRAAALARGRTGHGQRAREPEAEGGAA